MTKIAMISLAAALSVAPAAPTLAQSVGAQGQAQGQATSQAASQFAQAGASGNAQAQAGAGASVDARTMLAAVKEKGARVSAATRAKADAKLDAAVKQTNDEAQGNGDAHVATRLAAEFGTTANALTKERSAVGSSWGELMIAHNLSANAKTRITVAQLFELRQEGIGWAQVAAGLGLKLGDVVSAAQTEARVAVGLARPDGKVAVIHGDGARAGVSANADASAGLQAGGVQSSAQAGLGVGVKIKP